MAAVSGLLALQPAGVAGASLTGGTAARSLQARRSAARPQAELTEHEAFQFGLRAYVYGLPLVGLLTQAASATSVTVPDGMGDAPVNELGNARKLASPYGRLVIQPNTDTLYTDAYLDLSGGPLVLHVPRIGHHRYYTFEFLDPFTNVFAYVGTRTTGDGAHTFLVVGPDWDGRAPHHLRIIRSHYNRVWVLGRTLVRSASDLAAVHKIQNGYTLMPLPDYLRFGLNWRRARPKRVVDSPTQQALPIGLPFFDALGRALAANPPPPADRPLLRSLRKVGIGPGREPSQEQLSPAVLAGLSAAANDGQVYIEQLRQRLFGTSVASHDGWFVPPPNTGAYGTDYNLRAVIAQSGPGANRPAEAMYVIGADDASLQPMVGLDSYVLHFAASALPPANYFWSLTMYDQLFLLVPNQINRYEISNRTPGLKYNPDGSLDIYLSHTPPAGGDSNWLPAPIGHFEVTLRLYGPRRSARDGSYRYPAITRLG